MTIQNVDDVIKNAPLFSDNRDYSLIQLPSRAILVAAGILAEVADPFSAIVVDKDEVTLIIPTELVVEFNTRLERISDHQITQEPYRLITLDIVLDFDLVGLMARVAQALADAGISILPIAAFSRDHILVPAAEYGKAVSALEHLKANITE